MAQAQTGRRSNGPRGRAGRASGSSSHPVGLLRDGARRTAGVLGPIAEKSAKPAMVASGALAGIAAGMAIASRGDRRLGDLPDVTRSIPVGGGTARTLLRATRELHATACTVNELAAEIRKVRELVHAEQNRSPIEVVLQGLTRRPEP
jgi:hypothetical protein